MVYLSADSAGSDHLITTQPEVELTTSRWQVRHPSVSMLLYYTECFGFILYQVVLHYIKRFEYLLM